MEDVLAQVSSRVICAHVMSKYSALSRSEGHSKWFLQKTLLEHDKSMDHPWMQMIYKQVFSVKQYATWLVLNRAIFKAMEKHLENPQAPLSTVHDASLLRTQALEVDLKRLLGSSWEEDASELEKKSKATQQYLQYLEKDVEKPFLFVAHHFLQYNAVLSGGAYLGKMVSEKLCVPHGAPGVRFYAFEGVNEGMEPKRVQKYLGDMDTLEIDEEMRLSMLRTMKRIYSDTEAMMTEVFELNPVKGISYKSSQDLGPGEPVAPFQEQVTLSLTQLASYKGEDGGRILMAVGGELLDVSSGRELYGPGGGYSILAGHDVTRCLATMSLEPEHLDDLQWSPDSAEDEEALKTWQARLKEKYPVAGKLSTDATASNSADDGLRQRKAAKTEDERCPISGKQGTCPMASFLGKKDEAPSTATTTSNGSFMKGKSLVASVQKKDSTEDSLFYRLCPLHWDDKTVKMVAMIAVASWVSGIFVGWNLRKMIAR